MPFVAPVARLEAVAREVRRLWDGERASSSVPNGSRPLRLGVRPEAEIPVYLAALGPGDVRLCTQARTVGSRSSCLGQACRTASASCARARTVEAQDVPCHGCVRGLPLAVASDIVEARKIAAWWLVFYLISMGPLYREALTR